MNPACLFVSTSWEVLHLGQGHVYLKKRRLLLDALW